ncbi:MAG TPA: molybdopterin dinucleotide binding domain-containing protein [Acidimicrobiales bacterium]|nr:molybdopterin dinucleotide binding domain-containing protein [Acidimicrobiales bacterium]
MAEVRTCCRCCPAGCGIVVTTDADDRVVGVRGDRDHPLSHGYTCPKARALPDFHHHPERLDRPTVALGVGADGLGPVEAGWTGVLDDLAGRLRELVDRHGPDSVGLYRATGTSLDTLGRRAGERFVRELGSLQYYSAATVDVAPAWRASEMVTGGGRELTPVWVPEDPASRFVLFVGCNPVVSHGYLTLLSDPIRRLRAVQRRGGQVWVCDPRRTETARLADGHLACRPGTDAVLLAWLAHELLAEGADAGELATWVAADDLAALREGLSGFTLDRVAARCGVAPAELSALLTAVRAAGRIGVVAGTGVTFGRHALVTEWLRWVLLIVTGSLDRPGGMWFNPGWMAALEQRAQWDHVPPEGTLEPGPASRPDLPRLFGQSPCAALVDEIEAGNLRGLLVAGGSPLTAFPDPERTAAAFRTLDVLAVVDVVATPLTAMATHVLPCTGQLERTDLVVLERTMVAPAVVPPAGDRRPCWWIFDQLGQRLGVDALGLAGAGDGDDGRPEAAEEEMLRALAGASRDGADALFTAGSHGMASPRLYGWVRDRALPGGRWRLVPPGLLGRLAELLEAADDEDDTAAAGLRLVSRRQVNANNATRYVPAERSADRPAVLVHPDDAAAHGVADGDAVELRSTTGRVTVAVQLDDGLRPGTVSVPHGWYGTNVCRLTDGDDVDPLTAQPQMSGYAVTLHPVVEDPA